ncbi:Keratinocyte proline-rich protein [Pteropus alecto]|uniref:Keratinocyte proline-rich protein n=1 Tax=Pteropus alecto TaxID=9402 RepID=L5JUZ7_PTEAL|nr:Keratinocyte proline-rich protein [Pteropus alecto]
MCDQQPIQCCLPLPQCCVKGSAFRFSPAPYANSQVVVQAPCDMQIVECPAPCPIQVSEVKGQAPCQPKTTQVKCQAPSQPKTTQVTCQAPSQTAQVTCQAPCQAQTTQVTYQAPCQAQTTQVTYQAPCQAQTTQVACQPEVCYVQCEAPGPVQTCYVDCAPACYTETCYLQYPVQTYAPRPAARPVRTYVACPPAFQTQGRFSTHPCSGPVPYAGDLGCRESRPYHLDAEAPSCGAAGYNQCGEIGASYGPGDVFPEPRGLGGYGDYAGACVGVKGGAGAGAKGAYF